MGRPKKQPEQTTAAAPEVTKEEIAQNQVAPDIPQEPVVEISGNGANSTINTESAKNTTVTNAGGGISTPTVETVTESPVTTTLPVEPVVEYQPQPETISIPKNINVKEEDGKISFEIPNDKVIVDKEALYRMLVGLARGHTQSYTYERAKQMVGKLFGIQGEEFQKKWEEIKQFIG